MENHVTSQRGTRLLHSNYQSRPRRDRDYPNERLLHCLLGRTRKNTDNVRKFQAESSLFGIIRGVAARFRKQLSELRRTLVIFEVHSQEAVLSCFRREQPLVFGGKSETGEQEEKK